MANIFVHAVAPLLVINEQKRHFPYYVKATLVALVSLRAYDVARADGSSSESSSI